MPPSSALTVLPDPARLPARRFAFVFAACVLFFPISANAAPAPVQVEVVRSESVTETLELTGSITAVHAATLSTSVAGLVTARHVEVGDRVEAGDLLLELDSELVRLAADEARARAGEARARLDDARRRLEENRQLKDVVAASAVASLEAEVEQAEAMLAAASADQARQRALLERHALRAPFSGVISARHSDIGEWLAPGAGVFDLIATRNLRVDFQVAQRYLQRITDQASLRVRLEDGGDSWTADIDRRVPVLDPRSRSFLLRATLPEDAPFAPGMAVRATLVLPLGDNVLTVSRDALVRHPDGRVSVWAIAIEDGAPLARERSVKIDPGLGERVVILEGLNAGDRVVTHGNEALSAGQPVQLDEQE